MSNKTPPPLLSRREMQRLALIHVQAYLSACHCRSRTDVLQALTQWQNVGTDLADLIRHTRIIIIH